MKAADLQASLDSALNAVDLNAYSIRFGTQAGALLTPDPCIDATGQLPTDDPSNQLHSAETVYSFTVTIPLDTLDAALAATGLTKSQVLSVGARWQISQDRFGTNWQTVVVEGEPIYGDVAYVVKFTELGFGET